MSDFWTSIGCLVQDERKCFIAFYPEGKEKRLRTMNVWARFHAIHP